MGSLDIVNEDFEDIQKSAVSQEFRLQSTGEGRLHWIVGGIWAKDKRDEVESVNFGTDQTTLDTFGVFPHFIIELSSVDRDITSKAVFAETTWEATERLSLTAGARWSEDEIDLEETKIDFETCSRRKRPPIPGAMSRPALRRPMQSRKTSTFMPRSPRAGNPAASISSSRRHRIRSTSSMRRPSGTMKSASSRCCWTIAFAAAWRPSSSTGRTSR